MSYFEDKSEWDEPQLIIPMTDIVITKDSDKSINNVAALGQLNSEEQMFLSNGVENGLVIGLGSECLENMKKKELLVFQNSNLKLQPFGLETKYSTSYSFSYIDQGKNEVLWEGLLSKEIDESDFDDKKLQFNESLPESSKNWQKELEETDSITLNKNKVISTLQNCKNEEKIILAIKKNNSNINNISKNSFSIGNYSFLQNLLAPESSLTNELKSVESKIIILPNENFHFINLNKTIEKESSNTAVIKKKLPLDFREMSKSELSNKKKLIKREVDSSKNCSSNNIYFEKLKPENCASKSLKKIPVKNSIDSNKKAASGDSGLSLPEKSLPLKKKAKMKNTIISQSQVIENSRCFSKNKNISNSNGKINLNKVKLRDSCLLKKSVKSAVNILNCKSRKKKKNVRTGFSQSSNLKKQTEHTKEIFYQKNYCFNQIKDCKEEKTKFNFKSEKLECEAFLKTKEINNFPFDFNPNKFDNIYELVDKLKACKTINSSLWQILHSGLKEMDIDILQEMRNKHKMPHLNVNKCYSPQLKAFALVLYFKQPAAFHHLAKTYKNGWPSLSIIKDWKRKINRITKTNFITLQNAVLES